MAKRISWSDEYWLPLMQLYLKKPSGVKPLYSKPLVNLALELHIQPQLLYEQMLRLRGMTTPRMERLWQAYAKSPQKLARGVSIMRQRNGFGQAEAFYRGVEITESWEKDFKPLNEDEAVTPVMLIIILDLYFRLTPITMVPETPEIVSLGRLIGLQPAKVCEIMTIYMDCDPYLRRSQATGHPLLQPCKAIWQRYGNDNPEKLAALAAQLKDYFK